MNKNDETIIQVSDEEVEKLLQVLPKATSLNGKLSLAKFQGFWYHMYDLRRIITFPPGHFRARDSDIIITSYPKTGLTWLKTLLYSVINRSNHPLNQSPLLTNNPHDIVFDLEYESFDREINKIPTLPIDEIPSPRLFATHIPYNYLPQTIKASKCRILYIGRNPLDTIVSQWHFLLKATKNMVPMVQEISNDNGHDDDSQLPPLIEDYFEDFCEGKTPYGPFFDHLNAFWKWSKEEPNKVLFLKYEDLKTDTYFWLKKIAEFAGVPFSPQEETQGVIQQIIEFCSIGNMKDLEVNRQGRLGTSIYDKKDFFRKGEVGDWNNYFTPLMVEMMKKLMDDKFGTTGLSLDLVV